jgi:endoglucanase
MGLTKIYIIGGKGMKKLKGVIFLFFMLTLPGIFLMSCTNSNKTENIMQQEEVVTESPAQGSEPTAGPTAGPTETAASVTAESVTTDTATPTAAPELTEATAPIPADSWSDDMKEMSDISSIDLVKEIKIGWNLGNTMDATGGSGVTSEISWGNPITTKELIDAVKAAGFNTLRIPTTWQNHLGPAPDYTINKAWLDHIQLIVDYAMANDMYVIINAHHEDWYFPSYDNLDVAKDELNKVWLQIADRFENYDEHLIFEGMNEPRQKGTPNEWNGGNAEGWDCVNQLNQVFVDTIRNAGGNNPLRHLMVMPYAASSAGNAWSGFTVPEDDKVIVSIHAYTPYNFALNKTGTDTWSSSNASDTRDIDSLMNNINNQFISKGIPVILGEFGAMNKENLDSRVDWAKYYISKAAEKGIPCIWWDNGAFVGSGENFGLINRYDLTWKYPEIVDAMMNGLK